MKTCVRLPLLILALAVTSLPAASPPPATAPATSRPAEASSLPDEATRVTLDLRNVPAREAASRLLALAKRSIELPQGTWEPDGGPLVSIQAQDQPFLVVLHDLAKQAQVTPQFNVANDQVMLNVATPAFRPPQGLRDSVMNSPLTAWVGSPAVAAGPFLIVARSVRESASKAYRGIGADRTHCFVSLSVLVEPHVRVFEMMRPVEITEAIDDRGRSLMTPQTWQRDPFTVYRLSDAVATQWDLSVDLAVPAADARKISVLAGNVRAVVQHKVVGIEVPNITESVGKSVEAEGVVLQIETFQPTSNYYKITATITPKDPNDPRWEQFRSRPQILHDRVRLTDAHGVDLTRYTVDTNGSTPEQVRLTAMFRPREDPVGNPVSGPPAKLMIMTAVQAKTLVLPFRFTSLALPR